MARFTFSAKKMIDRVKAEGRGDLLDEVTMAKIMQLDGASGSDYNWENQVNGQNLVWLEEFKTYVNKDDCN